MKLTATTVMGLLKKAHSNKDRQNREEDDKVLKLGKQRTKRTYCNLPGDNACLCPLSQPPTLKFLVLVSLKNVLL